MKHTFKNLFLGNKRPIKAVEHTNVVLDIPLPDSWGAPLLSYNQIHGIAEENPSTVFFGNGSLVDNEEESTSPIDHAVQPVANSRLPDLPIDVIYHIIEQLGTPKSEYLSFKHLIDTHVRGSGDDNKALLRAALVCKEWYLIAKPLLYRHMRVPFVHSIKRLNGTLEYIPSLRNGIQSFAFIGCKKQLEIDGCFYPALYNLCALMPAGIPLHFKLVDKDSLMLLEGYCNTIQSLHLYSPRRSRLIPMEVLLPQLKSLTLEEFFWGDVSPIKLEVPQLTTLRLIRPISSLGASEAGFSWLRSVMEVIKHCEVLHGYSPFCGMILQHCAPKLESITLNPYDDCWQTDGNQRWDFSRFVHLKQITLNLCDPVGDYDSDEPIVFPPSLERLEFCEVEMIESWRERGSAKRATHSKQCIPRMVRILRLVKKNRQTMPNLAEVAIIGCEHAWGGSKLRSSAEQQCIELGVALQFKLWKGCWYDHARVDACESIIAELGDEEEYMDATMKTNEGSHKLWGRFFKGNKR